MNEETRERLTAAGFTICDAEDFLELTDEERRALDRASRADPGSDRSPSVEETVQFIREKYDTLFRRLAE